jgi:ribosomal protein L29
MTDFLKKTDQDLIKLLSQKREALRAVRFNISGGKKRDVKESQNDRREIARILTELSSRARTV